LLPESRAGAGAFALPSAFLAVAVASQAHSERAGCCPAMAAIRKCSSPSNNNLYMVGQASIDASLLSALLDHPFSHNQRRSTQSLWEFFPDPEVDILTPGFITVLQQLSTIALLTSRGKTLTQTAEESRFLEHNPTVILLYTLRLQLLQQLPLLLLLLLITYFHAQHGQL
jgi:hypothetical protein